MTGLLLKAFCTSSSGHRSIGHPVIQTEKDKDDESGEEEEVAIEDPLIVATTQQINGWRCSYASRDDSAKQTKRIHRYISASAKSQGWNDVAVGAAPERKITKAKKKVAAMNWKARKQVASKKCSKYFRQKRKFAASS